MATTTVSIFRGAPPGEYSARRLATMPKHRGPIAPSNEGPRAGALTLVRPHAIGSPTAIEPTTAAVPSVVLQGTCVSTSAPPPPIPPSAAPYHDPIDALLIAILEAPLGAGASTQACFVRKERELAEIFATLGGAASLAMQSRLTRCSPGDELAAKFARLTSDRRARLVHYLADVTRREALARVGHR